MAIIGVIASSTRQGQATDLGAMFPLQVVTIGATSASTITFSNIPSTYKHLQIRGLHRTLRAADTDNMHIFFNSDTGSNYGWHQFVGDGAGGVSNNGAGSQNVNYTAGTTYGATGLANTFGASVIDILDYANTNKNKTVKSLVGKDANNSSQSEVGLRSCVWVNTAAITSITIQTQTGANFAQYTTFGLYGIKAAS